MDEESIPSHQEFGGAGENRTQVKGFADLPQRSSNIFGFSASVRAVPQLVRILSPSITLISTEVIGQHTGDECCRRH
jgi:hypothetical protein